MLIFCNGGSIMLYPCNTKCKFVDVLLLYFFWQSVISLISLCTSIFQSTWYWYFFWPFHIYIFQLLDLSGILTVFFSGIVMSHYTWHNVTESSRITTKYVLSDNQFYWQPLWFLLDENIYVYGFLIFFIHFTGTLLLLYLSLLKFFYFSMLGWMHWTLKNGN